ncbi:MAG: DUF3253 domain-containing protein [Pseudomonadota bacterium]
MTRDPHPTDAEIVAVMWALAETRAPKSFCPSEVARRVSDDWRPLMPRIRALSRAEGLRATQRGQPVDAEAARGPIRLSKP